MSMASSTSSSASSPSSSSASASASASSHHHEHIHPHLLRQLVTLINNHAHSLLSNPKARKTLQNKCTSSLISTREHNSLDMSEQTVLSNLYRGIRNVELCIKCSEHIVTCEKMLQAPASLDENGVTAGVCNAFLVCCAYFYLCLLRKLVEGDEVQVALYFLQALVVSPELVKSELAPEVYRNVVESCIVPLRPELGSGVEGVRWGATSYKAWLMYYQVISYGQQQKASLLMDTSAEFRNTKVCRTSSSKSYEHVQLHAQNCVKVHPIDPRQNEHDATVEPTVSNKVLENSGVKRLQDLLLEDQSDTYSLYSDTSEYADDDSQESVVEFDKSLRTLREALEEQELETSITMSKTPETLNFSCPSSELVFWNCLQNEDETTCQTFQRQYTQESSIRRDEISFSGENSYRVEQAEIVEKVISKLCFSENDNDDDSMSVEITTVYNMLASKPGLKYSLLKDVILDQLLMALSTSKEEGVIRASVSILLSIVSSNPSVIGDVKKKGLNLTDLTNALKRDVYEAAVLIYLINPSPNEIKCLDLMPTLIKIICCYTSGLNLNSKSPVMTPPFASIMIIQVMVSAFDYATNDTYLAEICSPKVISGLVNVPRNGSLEEVITLADILVKCMRFDGQCRYHISQFTPISPFVSLILSNHLDGVMMGLEYYHELLRMPRSSTTSLLHQLKEQGGIDIICVLLLAIQQTQPEYKVLAASLLLQLDVLEESVDNILNREVAIKTLLESLTCEENPDAQQLAAFILSNIGGTYAWSGDSYTIAWLVKKTGLNSMLHKNIVKNIDWLDDTLQECGTEVWCAKVARDIIKLGDPVFYALEKGLKSKNKRVSRYSLTTIAWIGCEIVKASDDLRCLACDILLSTIEQYVHPGMDLEERLLACLCIYNYTFGRGMQKLTQLSEGVRESLRRLSSITWMAEELLKVADYYMPNKWRISCVHTQVLEANYNGSGAVNSLMYYRGHLFSGYSNGSIKVWDIKGQTATLILDIMEHKKAVTCLALLEQGNYLLSGSSDKTIRIWQMFERKLQCIEVITTKESIQSLETCGEMIFVVTHSHKMKAFDSSRKANDVLKNKHVKCIRSGQGKVYIGCMDSSIQELYIGNNRQQEIKAPSKSWTMQNKPIYSLALYKDWLYSASTCVDGSKIKDWKRQSKAQVSIVTEKRENVLAMDIVEDFIYLNTSNSPSNLEIWLRGTQHKVGRLSAGSKITSMLAANDMILCGTGSGLIKGWIPL